MNWGWTVDKVWVTEDLSKYTNPRRTPRITEEYSHPDEKEPALAYTLPFSTEVWTDRWAV